jgi:hypothetical protein
MFNCHCQYPGDPFRRAQANWLRSDFQYDPITVEVGHGKFPITFAIQDESQSVNLDCQAKQE